MYNVFHGPPSRIFLIRNKLVSANISSILIRNVGVKSKAWKNSKDEAFLQIVPLI